MSLAWGQNSTSTRKKWICFKIPHPTLWKEIRHCNDTQNVYATTLDTVVKSVIGKPDIKKNNPEYIATTKQAWVKSLARDMAFKLA